MDKNHIIYILDTFSQYKHFFVFEDLLNFAAPDLDIELLAQELLADYRFILLDKNKYNKDYYIPKRRLFEWFFQLNFMLAKAKQFRLSKYQLTMLMSFLCHHKQWDTPPTEVTQFAEQFGLIGITCADNQYIFPLAYVLSFMSHKISEVTVKYIIKEIPSDIIDADFSFRPLAQKLIQEKFSCFTYRECYVVKAREGLLTGKKMTLNSIGLRFGITRERVRQIEAKCWRKIHHPAHIPSFSKALIYNIMGKQGSLVFASKSSEALNISFLAKCLDVPCITIPQVKLLVLGSFPKDIILPKSSKKILNDICTNNMIKSLGLEDKTCLIKRDLELLAEKIRSFQLKCLTKRQKVYLALRAIGKPAHSSKITEVYNSLFSDQPSTEHNIHAVLSHEKCGVVWIGIRSTFALKEWGYEHPSETLFDTVTKIVEEKYKETARPVPFTIIVTEMGKYRQIVKHSSLTIASHCNPNLHRIGKNSFIPKKPDEEMQKEISAEELDRVLREFKTKEHGESTNANIPKNEKISQKTKKLPDAKIKRYKKIFQLYKEFGTFERVARKSSLTSERVRQILEKGNQYGLFEYSIKKIKLLQLIKQRKRVREALKLEKRERWKI